MSSEFASLEVFMIRDRGNLIVGDTHHMIGGEELLQLIDTVDFFLA